MEHQTINMETEKSLTNLQAVQLSGTSFATWAVEEPESSIKQCLFQSQSNGIRSCEEVKYSTELNVDKDNVSQSERSTKCQECGKDFKTERWLKKHLLNHSKKQSYECDLCGKGFKRNFMLKAHQREVHSLKKQYSCAQCDYATNNKSNFETHFTIRHLDVKKSGVKCDRCDKKYFRKEDLMRHKIKEHNAPRFKCDLCDKSYTSTQYLRIHKVTHRPDFKQEHQCVECGKMFPSGGTLNSHMRKKHTGLQYSCKECGKNVSSPSCLRDHMTQHSGVKAFECSVCGKRFATLKYLQIHSRTHSGEKPYSCKECDKTFTQRSSLSVHTRRYHMEVKPYRCNLCLKGFVTTTLLKNHLKGHLTVISSVESGSNS